MRSIIVLFGILWCLFATTAALGSYICPGRDPLANCPVFNPGNGHYYAIGGIREPSLDPISWDNASAEAATFEFQGVTGHLATITSAEENEFLRQARMLGPFWIGASDRDVEGEWRWVVGPEAGTLFWLGGPDGEAVGYANWVGSRRAERRGWG
jgi:hypothetical protein